MKKAIQILTATLATIALAACQPHDEMEQEQGTVTVNEISVQVQQLSSMGGTGTGTTTTTTRADESIMAGVEKKNFVEGDVIHILVQISSSAPDDNDPCYTATLNANGQWTLNKPIVLPQDATKTRKIEAFYDGVRTHYTNYKDWELALDVAMNGTPSDGSNPKKYVDLLHTYGENSGGFGWTDYGIAITSNGKLTITMKHIHALLRIASITNNLGSPVAGIMANLTDKSDNSPYTVALATTTPATTPIENAEAIAKLGSYLKSFTITLENGRQLTVDVPGYNSNPGGTPTGSGTQLYSGKSYTYRLHLNPGSLTAIPEDGSIGDAPGWDNQVDPNVPDGYTPIYDRAGLEAMGNTDNLNNPEAKFILMADIDLTPGNPTSPATEELWTPIGNIDGSREFIGIFNGNGHTIKGMTVAGGSSDFQGLFGYIGSSAILYNIHLRDVNVTGGSYTGALVGDAGDTTTISGCSSTGTVSGGSYVGGLVGNNSSHITRCWSTATVTGSGDNIGGLVGNNNGYIVACYTQGSKVSSGTGSTARGLGGLVGYNFSGTIFGCYAAQAEVTDGTYMGALVGGNHFGTVTSCYATNASGSSGNKLAGGNGENAKFTACISPLADVTGEVAGTGGSITGSTAPDGYAPLISKDANGNELSILDVRTVIPTGGNLGAITTATRTWTAAGIWGTLTTPAPLAPHIKWTYNGESAPPAP